MQRVLRLIVLVCLVVLTPYAANAGERDDTKEKLLDRIETLTMWRMMQTLDLDNETSQKILQVRGRFLAERKGLKSSLYKSYGDLRKYLKEAQSKGNDEKLARTIEKIRKTRQELRAVWERQFDEIAKVLPVRKQAELVIFMKDFRKEIRAILRGPEGMPPRPPVEQGYDRGPGRGRMMGPSSGLQGHNPGAGSQQGSPGGSEASDDSYEIPGE
ncbi:MAG: hypothetical protein RDU20_01435 [Desulfomonilaceae bacterium]|nr:hypothetical protein [Desulfomonilaceae bacterium]